MVVMLLWCILFELVTVAWLRQKDWIRSDIFKILLEESRRVQNTATSDDMDMGVDQDGAQQAIQYALKKLWQALYYGGEVLADDRFEDYEVNQS